MTWMILVAGAFFLAWSNGANDNFKGVATLYGSGTASFSKALAWATGATLLGSLVSVFFAQELVKAFSGAGLVPDQLIGAPLLASVGLAAAVTIALATYLGMPTSTTHALTGALVGAALVADSAGIDWHRLAMSFAQPLLLSPILAMLITAVSYPALRTMSRRAGVTRHTCVCIGEQRFQRVRVGQDGTAVFNDTDGSLTTLTVDQHDRCIERYQGRLVGIDAQAAIDTVHYASGGALCFARSVNDTPKIAALLIAGGVGAADTSALLLTALAMAAGGLVQSRAVAETMSKRITDLDSGQGLTANLVTAGLVLAASRIGVPVSTTHVSCGSIFAIGMVNRTQKWRTIAQILITWVTTLPLALVLGAAMYRVGMAMGS